MARVVSGARARHWGAVFVGGMVGALARVALSELFGSGRGDWPWAVFIINVSGAFLLGYLAARPAPLADHVRALTQTGFCGAYTTFATLQLELLWMLRDGRWRLALAYTLATLLCGYGLLRAGSALARRRGVRERVAA